MESNIKNFWDARGKERFQYIHQSSNLEDDTSRSINKSKIEINRVKEVLQKYTPTNTKFCIEVGAGTGQWTELLTSIFANVLATDISLNMLEQCKCECIKKGITNVTYYHGDITKRNRNLSNIAKIDCIFLSGILLYMNEESVLGLKRIIREKLNPGGLILLREPIALKEKLILNNIFSEKLQSNYSAIYRTKLELIKIFSETKITLVYDNFMHKDNSEFNKWGNTRLNLMAFKSNG